MRQPLCDHRLPGHEPSTAIAPTAARLCRQHLTSAVCDTCTITPCAYRSSRRCKDLSCSIAARTWLRPDAETRACHLHKNCERRLIRSECHGRAAHAVSAEYTNFQLLALERSIDNRGQAMFRKYHPLEWLIGLDQHIALREMDRLQVRAQGHKRRCRQRPTTACCGPGGLMYVTIPACLPECLLEEHSSSPSCRRPKHVCIFSNRRLKR